VSEQPGFHTHELSVIFFHGLTSFRSWHRCAFSEVIPYGYFPNLQDRLLGMAESLL